MAKFLVSLVALFLLGACNPGNRSRIKDSIHAAKPDSLRCDSLSRKNVYLYPVSTTIKLPDWRLEDSAKFSRDLIVNYHILTLDSSLRVFASVTAKDSTDVHSIERTILDKRDQMESEQDSMIRVYEGVKDIGNTRAGLIKYKVTRNGGRVHEACLFFYKERKFVEIRLYQQLKGKRNEDELIECIIGNIQITE